MITKCLKNLTKTSQKNPIKISFDKSQKKTLKYDSIKKSIKNLFQIASKKHNEKLQKRIKKFEMN